MYPLPLDLVSKNQLSTNQNLFNTCPNSRNDRWTFIIPLDIVCTYTIFFNLKKFSTHEKMQFRPLMYVILAYLQNKLVNMLFETETPSPFLAVGLVVYWHRCTDTVRGVQRNTTCPTDQNVQECTQSENKDKMAPYFLKKCLRI